MISQQNMDFAIFVCSDDGIELSGGGWEMMKYLVESLRAHIKIQENWAEH